MKLVVAALLVLALTTSSWNSDTTTTTTTTVFGFVSGFSPPTTPVTTTAMKTTKVLSLPSSTTSHRRHGQQQQQQHHRSLSRSSSSSSSSSSTTTSLHALIDIVGVSPEPIHTAFSFATFGPQPFWILMIGLPNANITKKCMTTLDVVLFFALVHFFIVVSAILQQDATAPLAEFNNVFDPAQDTQASFMKMVTNYPNFVAEEWPHVLTWDLFVGRYIWLDGIRRGIFTRHSVLFANLIGPPGLLLHWLTCLIVGKDINGGIVESITQEEE